MLLTSISCCVGIALPVIRPDFDVEVGTEIWGDSVRDAFGSAVSLIADLNDDGVADIIVGAFNILEANPVLQALSGRRSRGGYIRILSGRDGSQLKTIRDKNESLGLGLSALGIVDVDHDGYADIAAGVTEFNFAPSINPLSNGSAYVRFYSGKTGALVKELRASFFADVRLASLDDVNGDGVVDLLCAFSSSSDKSEVWIVSGKSLERLYRITKEKRGFGCSVSAVPDVDGDSVCDFAVGAMVEDKKDVRGEVFIFSGKTGQQITSIISKDVDDSFGCAVLGISDANADGAGDVLIGARRARRDGRAPGAVYVYSSTGSRRLYEVYGQHTESGFGNAMSNCGDRTGDKHEEIAVSSWSSENYKSGEGCTKLYSSKDWSVVCEIPGNVPAAVPTGIGTTAFDVIVGAPRLQEPDTARGVVRGFRLKSK